MSDSTALHHSVPILEEPHTSLQYGSVPVSGSDSMDPVKAEGKRRSLAMHHLLVDAETFGQWRQIAADQELRDDTDVAAFLIWHFLKTPSRCSACDSWLKWCCPRCVSANSVSRQSNTEANSSVEAVTAYRGIGTMAATDDTCGEDDEADANSDDVSNVLKKVASGQKTLTRTHISTESEDFELYSRLAVKFDTGADSSSDRTKLDFVQDGSHDDQKVSVKLHQPKTGKDKITLPKSASKSTAKKKKKRGLAAANAADTAGRNVGWRGRRFECDKCKRLFLDSKDLRRHMRTHTGERPFVCDQCGAAFSLACTLKRHKLTHPGQLPYHCEECGSRFHSVAALQKHQCVHSGERPYLCEECGAAFTHPKNLQAHVKNNHTGDMLHACQVCCARFKTANQLSIHKKLHSGEERPYQCSECGITFPSHEEMKEHKRTHVSKLEFKCQQCGGVFKTSKLLTQHMEIHAVDTESVHCMDSHVLSQESSSPHGLGMSDSWGSAALTQDENGTEQYLCDLCNETLLTLEDWKRHTQAHRQEKSFTCTTCSSTFKTPRGFKEHVRSHNGEKPYICTECNAAFNNLTNLKAHTRTHTGFKPFVCKMCNAAFAQSSNLKRHVRTHTGEKLYGCSQCGVTYTKSESLRIHMRTHSGDRPYVCEQCGTCFASAQYLKRHARRHAHSAGKTTADAGENDLRPAVATERGTGIGVDDYYKQAFKLTLETLYNTQ